MKTLLLSSILFLFSSCGADSQSKKELITIPNPQQVAQYYQIEESLRTHSLKYYENYKDFSGGHVAFSPCEEQFYDDLQSAETDLTNLVQLLGPDEDKYKEIALDFFRRVVHAKNSIVEILQLVEPFCQTENQIALKCLKGDDSLKVFINKHVSGYEIVHPVFKPQSSSEVFIIHFNDRNELRTVDIDSGELANENPSINLTRNAKKKDLKKISQCLSEKNLKTQIGQIINTTSARASENAIALCAERGESYPFYCQD
jgi:hypothetical protein